MSSRTKPSAVEGFRRFADRFFAQDSPLWKTGFGLLLHEIQHRCNHSDHPGSNSWLRDRCEFTRMQGRQFLPRLFELLDLCRIDRAEVKIHRWNGVVRQAVFGKIVAAHGWIDHL